MKTKNTKNLKKLLQYSQKLEELQTARKAKDVDEISKFDAQMERHKYAELEWVSRIDKVCVADHQRTLNEIILDEQKFHQSKEAKHLETEEFNQEALKNRINAPENDFEVITELQESSEILQQRATKQLPSDTIDVFSGEMAEMTEKLLQSELTQNQAALTPEPEENIDDAKKPAKITFSHPIKK